MSIQMTGKKLCFSCQRELHVICFSVNSGNADGLCGRCRECRAEEYRAKKKVGREDKYSFPLSNTGT
jgi:hypothetical protein